LSELTTTAIVNRIKMAHAWILQATEKLTEDELCQSFAFTAPPIGWHLWHIARWADRVQASLPRQSDTTDHRPDPNQGVWQQERLAERWDLDPATLGTLEEGSGMALDASTALPRRIGRDALLAYAMQTFAATDAVVADLRPDQFLEQRSSVMEYKYDVTDGRIWRAPGAETTVVADLAFHLSHANRHLGMIEALSGLLNKKGSVTV
jgi:hypothetical protein